MSGQMVAAHRDAMSFGINPPRGARAHGGPWDAGVRVSDNLKRW